MAAAGEPAAVQIVTTAGAALGAAIGQLVNMLDPEAVVIGGGLGLAEGLYRSALEESLRRQIWSELHRDVPLLSAEMGNDAGFIGAAIAASNLMSSHSKMIEPEILSDHESLSRRAADWLVERIRQRPDALISLAAGSTPKRTYELLAERGVSEPATLASCRFIKLDEWGGLAMDDAATCEHQLQTLLIGPLDAARRYTAFQSDSPNPAAECDRIAGWLAKTGRSTSRCWVWESMATSASTNRRPTCSRTPTWPSFPPRRWGTKCCSRATGYQRME